MKRKTIIFRIILKSKLIKKDILKKDNSFLKRNTKKNGGLSKFMLSFYVFGCNITICTTL